MNKNFVSFLMSTGKKHVTLNGDSNLSVEDVLSIARKCLPVHIKLTPEKKQRMQDSYDHMMEQVRNGIPIYGTNSSFGAQAGRLHHDGDEEERVKIARRISESILIADVSVGPSLPKDVVRAAMLIRVNMLLPGMSAVKLDDLSIFIEMLNKDITPIVGSYGSIGASGDLAQNCRILNAAMQRSTTKVIDRNGVTRTADNALTAAGLKKLELGPKAGLGLVNGDNFSTAAAALLFVDTVQLMLLNTAVSALIIQALRGTDRSFHPILSGVRLHPGQKFAALLYRKLLQGSKLSYQEMSGHKLRESGVKVQDGYSLRCLSQFFAPHWENLIRIKDTITTNINSVSDNPIWVPPDYATDGEKPWQWVSGGNFLGIHMAESIDQMRKILTHITKVNDRHLARLINRNENNGLPDNLSDNKSLTKCTFKGIQIQMGMMEVYSSVLSIPVTTFFGVHEEDNQDITAHGLTSWLLAKENLRLARYAVATNLIASMQAVDLRAVNEPEGKGKELLSPATQYLYDFIRKSIPYIDTDQSLSHYLEDIYNKISDPDTIAQLTEPLLDLLE
ncbi:histidine ammonia-lyase [Candidatus Scalindua japonica]|uniref:Histidine ammonia-lyase n=1 Tax=Candidatus Scalindua japonica TaxID=1284222 RepID=A0A286TXQ2_9BACT|nr:aromatic amino acid ammonia-lyase [Candidatus Scalindua japonica]GAX60656.1 histidine ammonia-lyase [Candidatus Scalindua japonica]